VLSQDFKDFELVICDNASTDNTPELIQRYSGDPRVRYLRFEDLTNQAGSFNRCLESANSDLISILHADDYYLPGFLRDRLDRFERDPNLGLVFGAVNVIDKDGNHISTSQHWKSDRHFAPRHLVNELVLACIVSPPSLMVRRATIERAGRFRSDLTWGHDWEWAIRLAESGSAQYVAKPFAAYRVHDASGTAEVLNAAQNGHQERIILHDTFRRLKENVNRSKAYRALSRRQIYFAEQSLLAGRSSVARNNLWYSVRADATMALRPTFWALLAATVSTPNVYKLYRRVR